MDDLERQRALPDDSRTMFFGTVCTFVGECTKLWLPLFSPCAAGETCGDLYALSSCKFLKHLRPWPFVPDERSSECLDAGTVKTAAVRARSNSLSARAEHTVK